MNLWMATSDSWAMYPTGLAEKVVITGGCISIWALKQGKKLLASSWTPLEILTHLVRWEYWLIYVYPFCSQMNIETLQDNLYFQSKENLSAPLAAILERTEDFTDSAYTSHEHRERILDLSAQARMEVQQLISVWIQAVRTFFHQSKSYIIYSFSLRFWELWSKMEQRSLFPFLPPAWPEYPSHPALSVLDISRPVVFILASLDSVLPSPSLVYSVVPILPPNSPLNNSSSECFFRVKSRGTDPRLDVLGIWVVLPEPFRCTQFLTLRTADLKNLLRSRCSENKVVSPGWQKIFHPCTNSWSKIVEQPTNGLV